MDHRDFLLFLAGTLVPSCLVSCAATWLIRRVAVRVGFVDRPNESRKVHASATPLGGGLAIWLGVMLPFAIGELVLTLIWSGVSLEGWIPQLVQVHLEGLINQSSSLWFLLGGGSVLMVLGLMDDLHGLPWQLRLGIQFLVATTCVVWQGWSLTAFIAIPLLTVALSVFWIVALINSFNMLDNMDGLSAGVAAIAAAMLAVVLLLEPDPETQRPQLFVAGLLLVSVGALLGFLIHNRPPAKIFMGDAGSYFVGFLIAVATLLATFASYRGARPYAVFAPLCVMAVPLYDMTTVIWIRLREGRSPFEADKNHFSHRLVDLGFSKTQAVLTIYLTTVTCGLGAILLPRVDAVGACVILVLEVCVLTLIALIESTARRRIRQS